jgi:hypothetical protein
MYDEENQAAIAQGFGYGYLIEAVNELRAKGWATADAIEGICEGHELPRKQEQFLRNRLWV